MGEGRVYKRRAPTHKPTEIIDSEKSRPRRDGQRMAKEIEDELDDMLDEIDNILAENEEMLDNFVQVNGQ